jgi:hypothetical protein
MAERKGSLPGKFIVINIPTLTHSHIYLKKNSIFVAIFNDPAYAKVNYNLLSTSTLVSDAVANGGFGPVVAEGFGVGYATTDDSIGFMITSFLVRCWPVALVDLSYANYRLLSFFLA